MSITLQGGIVAMTKALAIDEAKHGVRVNAYVLFICTSEDIYVNIFLCTVFSRKMQVREE